MDSLQDAIAVRKLDDERKEVWNKLQELRNPVRNAYRESMIELYGMLSMPRSEPPRGFKMRTKGGKAFWCGVGFVAGLPVVGASSASSPGASDHSAWFYVSIAATIMGPIIAVISLGATIYYQRRGGKTSVNLEV